MQERNNASHLHNNEFTSKYMANEDSFEVRTMYFDALKSVSQRLNKSYC